MKTEGKSKPSASYGVRFSPSIIRAERRRGLLSGLGLILLSGVPFIDAFISTRHHEMVNLGSASNSFFVPPWVAVLFGLLLVLFGSAVLYLSIKRQKS